jgi:hypothetical protein
MLAIPIPLRAGAPALLAAAALGALAAQDAPPPSITYGRLEIRGFELREASFDPPYRVHSKEGETREYYCGWQIVIRGPGFPIRALDPVLWVDGVSLHCYDRRRTEEEEEELLFNVVDPVLLRAERALEVIYGRDERTRTKLLEPLDPEKLVRLPEDQRRALGLPELEGVTITLADRSGVVAGRGRLEPRRFQLALGLGDGSFKVVLEPVVLGPDGTFTTRVVGITSEVTHVYALLAGPGVPLPPGTMRGLPKGVEILDRKPVGTRPAPR